MRLAALALLVATAADAQCATGVTDNAQEFCGSKSLPDGAIVGFNGGDYPGLVVRGGGLYLDGTYSFVQSVGTMFFRDFGAASALGFVFDTGSTKNNEHTRWYNHGSLLMLLDAAGNLSLPGGGSFVVSGLHSGEYALKTSPGLYLPIGCDPTAMYWGHHGCVQAGAQSRMEAGFLFEAYNPHSTNGAATDHKFLVGYRGSVATQDDMRSTNIMWCDGTDVNPDPTQPSNRGPVGDPLYCTPPGPNNGPDGGVCNDWYRATDAGHAMDGEVVLWVNDVRSPCQCDSLYFDGGRSSSWRKLSDRSECKP